MPEDFRKRDAAAALPTLRDIRASTKEVAEQTQDAQASASCSASCDEETSELPDVVA
jgi:hypothetical protein